MDNGFDVLIDSKDDLERLLAKNTGGPSLQGYFLKCAERNRDALYIPGILVAVEAFNEDEDYFNCDRPEVLMNRGEFGIGGKIYIEGVGYRVCGGVTFSEEIKDFFEGEEFGYCNTMIATKLFLYVKERIRNEV